MENFRLLMLCSMLIFSTMVGGDPLPAPQDEIEHLIHYVEVSDCLFNRNGQWYSGVEAGDHLRTKYKSILNIWSTPTAEEFIRNIASHSSFSGTPYLIRCGSGDLTPSADWLLQELNRYRASQLNL